MNCLTDIADKKFLDMFPLGVVSQYDISTNKRIFRAIRDIVLIKPDPELERPSESTLLFLTEGERPWARTGRVVAVGPGTVCKDGSFDPTTVLPGDRVLYNQNLQQDYEDAGEKLVLTRERELLAILELATEVVQP